MVFFIFQERRKKTLQFSETRWNQKFCSLQLLITKKSWMKWETQSLLIQEVDVKIIFIWYFWAFCNIQVWVNMDFGVAKHFFNKNYSNSRLEVFCKKVFLKLLQKSQGNTYARIYFLINCSLSKRDSGKGIFLTILQRF